MQVDMTRSEARKMLLKHRGRLAALALELNVSAATLSQVLKGRSTSKRVLEAAIRAAVELGKVQQ